MKKYYQIVKGNNIILFIKYETREDIYISSLVFLCFKVIFIIYLKL